MLYAAVSMPDPVRLSDFAIALTVIVRVSLNKTVSLSGNNYEVVLEGDVLENTSTLLHGPAASAEADGSKDGNLPWRKRFQGRAESIWGRANPGLVTDNSRTSDGRG